MCVCIISIIHIFMTCNVITNKDIGRSNAMTISRKVIAKTALRGSTDGGAISGIVNTVAPHSAVVCIYVFFLYAHKTKVIMLV